MRLTLLLLILKLFNLATIVHSIEPSGAAWLAPKVVEFSHPAAPISRFDAKKILKLEDGLEEFPPLGPVRIIRGLMSSPSFSPISLSVNTRTNNLTDIYLKPIDHLVTTVNGSQATINYEYNLNQLAGPLNPFQPNKRTIIVIPGYMSGLRVQWMLDCQKSWLKLEDVNVILVHWSGGNKGLYSTAVSNVKLVARQVTIFLYYLSQLHGLDFESASFRESLTIVGHSLGAHVAAFVGQELGGQVGRITALDPAGPIFDKQKSIDRIDPSDAILVDILHTNGGRMRYVKAGIGFIKMAGKKLLGNLWNSIRKSDANTTSLANLLTSYSSEDEAAWFGLEYPSGHLDYYANGGSVQPGCNDQLHLCDHRRAYAIYRNALEFELRARQIYGAQSNTLKKGRHRLVAFPGADYAQFRSGFSIMRNCPMLITDNHLMNARARDMAYKQCTVPIDFVTPGPQLRRELEEEYGLPLSMLQRLPDRPLSDWRDTDFEERRLYFETMSREPLVGEHHLMQVHLDRNKRIHWNEGCRFTCKVESREEKDLFSLVDYKYDSLEPVEYDQFYGLCFLLVNPNDWRYGTPLDGEVSDLDEEDCYDCTDPRPNGEMPQTTRSTDDDLTDFMNIEVSYNGVSLNNIRMVPKEPNKKKIQHSQCILNINSIKTRPLTTLVYNVSSWYNNNEQTAALDDAEEWTLHSRNGYGINWQGGLLVPNNYRSTSRSPPPRSRPVEGPPKTLGTVAIGSC